MCSVCYNFRYFKVWNIFNQAFYKFEDVFSYSSLFCLGALSILRQSLRPYGSDLS